MEQLPNEIVEEILLRFPPADPASLVRAALVCKPWCRIVCGRSFRRRFMELHRVAPLLGFLFTPYAARFVSTSSFRPPHAANLLALHDCEGEEGEEEEEVWSRDCVALDARHGLVLLYLELGQDPSDDALLVWDPTTDERREICPLPDTCRDRFDWNAAVLCTPTPSSSGHLDCHDMRFIVVRVVTAGWSHGCLRVYSSEDASWSEQTLTPQCSVDNEPNALVGNTLYFMTDVGTRVLSFHLPTWETSLIHLPPGESEGATVLMAMEEGMVGWVVQD